jgi:hypothetical protein
LHSSEEAAPRQPGSPSPRASPPSPPPPSPGRSAGQELRRWGPDAPWAAQGLVDAAFGPGGSLLLLTAARVVHWLQPAGGAGWGRGAGAEAAAMRGGSFGAGGPAGDAVTAFSVAVRRGAAGLASQAASQAPHHVEPRARVHRGRGASLAAAAASRASSCRVASRTLAPLAAAACPPTPSRPSLPQRYHGTAHCLACDDAGSLLVCGDGGAGAAAASAAPPAPGAAAAAARAGADGATLSVWRLQGREARPRASWGRPPRAPWTVAGLAYWAMGYSTAPPPRPWRAALSPTGLHVAVVADGG